jgi:hypothetical protein
LTRSLMGSENSADHAWDFLSSWFLDMGSGAGNGVKIRFHERHPNIIGVPGPDALAAAATVPGGLEPALVFDACQTGVVLRAVLFVELCAGVGVTFAADTFLDWVIRLALVTGGTLPATLSVVAGGLCIQQVLAR